MRLAVPVLIIQEHEGKAPVWRVKPVLHSQPLIRHSDLDRALQTMGDELRRMAQVWASESDHAALAAMAYDPGLEERRVSVALDLRHTTFSGEVLLAVHPMPGGRCCSPVDIPNAWFQVGDESDFLSVVSDQLSLIARRLLEAEDDLERLRAPRRGWIATVPVVVAVDEGRTRAAAKNGPQRDDLQPETTVDGARELERVGICLGRGSADQPVWPRQDLVVEIANLLATSERRSLVLVGPSGSGKTALIEAVARVRRGQPKRGRIWQLAPGRVISGMSYVGQWQARVEAICNHAARQDHVLYIDDLIGLLRAGASSRRGVGVGVGRMIHGYLADGRLRLLGEATPEVLQKVQELDRGFADTLRVLMVPALGEEQGVEALVRLLAVIESANGCRFTPDGLRTVRELARRFRGERAMPGSAADLVRALGATQATIDRDVAIAHFSRISGIRSDLLDARIKMDRSALAQSLSREVLGQEHAVQAMVEALVLAKAGLNDPGRPLQSLLFLGPTGVGKTQCARALARVLFGSSERMLRFDLNEFAGADAVDRLVGTPALPEGALVGAIRRQPYAVVLFDEVEKAHPSVFDLLLQVLGEARLSDAAGRLASFANAVIIMTSNLGTAEAASAGFGFVAGQPALHDAYRHAVESFFRPEFVARIDRLVAFHVLGDAELVGIVRQQVIELQGRSGLERHRQRLDVAEPVVRWLVERSRSEAIGGRGVRRLLARHLVQPLSNLLASTTCAPGRVLIAMDSDRPGVRLMPYVLADARPLVAAAAPALEQALTTCLELRRRLDAHKPDGPLQLGEVSPTLAICFELGERLDGLRRHLLRCIEQRKRHVQAESDQPLLAGQRVDAQDWWRTWVGDRAALATASASAAERFSVDGIWVTLALMTQAVDDIGTVELTLTGGPEAMVVRKALALAWHGLGLVAEETSAGGWRLSGGGVRGVAGCFCGTHLVIDEARRIWPLSIAIAGHQRADGKSGEVAGEEGSSSQAVVMVWDAPGAEVIQLVLGLCSPLETVGDCWRAWQALWLQGGRP